MTWGINKFLIKRSDTISNKNGEKYNKYLLAKQKPIYLTNVQGLPVAKNIKIDKDKVQQNDFFYWVDNKRQLDLEKDVEGIAIIYVERISPSTYIVDNGEAFSYINVVGELIRYIPR